MTTHDLQPGSRERYEQIADPSLYWTQTDGQPIRETDRPTGHVRALEADRPTEPVRAESRPADQEDEAHVDADEPAYDDTNLFRPSSPAVYDDTDDEYTQYDYDTRRRQQFGGINWGAGFFGWLVAVGMSVLLTGLAAGGVIALERKVPAVSSTLHNDPRALPLVVAAALVTVLVTAAYTGGYVAGRMSRFDGGRQGAAVWVIALLLTGLAAGVALTFGTQYNVPGRLDLPSLPLPSGTHGLAGVITAAVALVGSLVTAIAGGRVGCRYHQKVDDFR